MTQAGQPPGQASAIDVEQAFDTADRLKKTVTEFRDDLVELGREWDKLAETWRGVAATAYEDPWHEWKKNAETLVEQLGASADMIGRTAYEFNMQSHQSAAAINQTGQRQ